MFIPLGRYRYLYLDAHYEKVRCDGQVQEAAVLKAVGVNEEGWRKVLGISISLSEAKVHWRTFLQSLVARGLCGVELIISDDHPGLRQARRARLRRCAPAALSMPSARNAQAYVPRQGMWAEVAADIRAVFNASDRQEAEQRLLAKAVQKYEKRASHLARWLEENIPEGLTVFAFPTRHRRFIRTTNGLEQLHWVVCRRSRVVGIFPNEASCPRLVTAIAMEISEDWLTGKAYLRFDDT